jgi:class 3 adenylate cyclase
MASTQMMTVLFTDIVGSTELASRLGPEEADRVRQGHFSLLRQALAATDGTEVKNLGDGLMAVYASPSAAVAGAVAMQQAVERDNVRSDQGVGLRVGISGGEVTVEDDDYFGDPVIEAARICAICDGGQILTADVVRSMAGRRSPHRFDDVGERDLKGLPEPVLIFEVAWEPAVSTSGIPLPDRLETPPGTLFGFIGRERELERLIEDVKHSAEGTRRVVFLSGEPGIGKTSLSRQAAQGAHGLGVCVLYGRCDEDLGMTYQPFAEALEHLVVHSDDALLKDHVEKNGGALLSLVPALAKRLPGVPESTGIDPDSERVRLFSAVVSLLQAASADSGLLLVVDDLHWSDRASLQLLKHVCASSSLPKVMILGTYRDSELAAGDALSDTMASIGRQVETHRIDVVGLEDFEILGMMENLAGHTLDDDGVGLAHAVRRETEGNPFFTTELLRHLGETGLVYQDDSGRWVASEDLYEKGLPQSVRAVVGQRVDRLGEDMRKTLSQAAVIGRDFDVNVLAEVVGIDDDAVLDLVEGAVQAGLLVEVEGIVDRFSFAHALTQHTLYEDLGATRRARAHRKIADVLEQRYGTAPDSRAAELARHFVAATQTADTAKALTYCKLAGDQALAQLAPADALGWFLQALDLYRQVPDDETLRCDLLIGLGTAQRRTGDPAHRQTLLDAAAIAMELGDRDRLVAAAIANNRGSASSAGEVDNDKIAALEDALDAVGNNDSPERARLLAILGAELTWGDDRDRWSTVVSDALAIARRLDDPLCFLQVTGTVWANDLTPQTVEDRLSDLDRAVSFAQRTEDLRAGLSASHGRAWACLQVADRTGLDLHLDSTKLLAERIGEPFESWEAMTLESVQALLVGDLERSQREAEGAFAIGAESVPEAMATYAAQLLAIHRVRGQWTELAGIAELMAGAAAQNPGLPVLRGSLARTYCDLARDDEAQAVIGNDISNSFADFPEDTTWMSCMTTLSEICIHLGRIDGAAALCDRLKPWHAQVSISGVTSQGPVAFHLGGLAALLGKTDKAEGYFAESLEVSQKLGSPYWIARTQCAWAELDLKAGVKPTGRAEPMLSDALVSARRYGFGALVERIEALSLDPPRHHMN